MSPPWAEHQFKVVIEFQKSNERGRNIKLKHNAAVLPPQLYARVMPEVWAAFMNDVQHLATTHPYVVRPGAGRVAGWLGGMVMGAVLGFCFVNPDGGDYGEWLPQVQAVVDRHVPAFAAGGCMLSIQQVHGNFWIQVDVDPAKMAVGLPAPSAAYPGHPDPYAVAHKSSVEYSPETKPGSNVPAGYPPAQPGYQPPSYQ